ncbi:PTS sugar transporter subunit IIA [Corallococcus praedator]|uniref:PTS sugar transporter subunit IIA n=1 Tax=Corallococcus praedator TaxID=2316724 RepID=A0ABX9QCR9_9BACT|nr:MULTISPECIES: PTS sugar transporter subunit IIA [Corallococcus]RKH12487.1 PTS sugar transporter subunit IIA [Corallococcus sp. CA047B]RKH27357.1 PTS sugar transporter subunit IIA [Corallococcus sp. CA031C]RKI02340.1 PTS sugar transporter subunit IIA [Corallococcus praedator]
MRWMDFLTVEAIQPSLQARDSDTLLQELAGLLAPEAGMTQHLLAYHLRERERLGSTVMEGGVAIPHCRVGGVRRIVTCLGIHRAGLAFGGPEHGRMHLFVGMATPPDTAGLHLGVLSRIAALLHSATLRDALLRTTTADEAHSLLAQAEATLHPYPAHPTHRDILHR